MYYDFGAYDMLYSEFKRICRESWSEKFNYLYIDMAKKKMKVNIVFFPRKAKTLKLNAFVKVKHFD